MVFYLGYSKDDSKIKVRKIKDKKGNNTSKKYTIKEINKISGSVVSRNEPMNEMEVNILSCKKGYRKKNALILLRGKNYLYCISSSLKLFQRCICIQHKVVAFLGWAFHFLALHD